MFTLRPPAPHSVSKIASVGRQKTGTLMDLISRRRLLTAEQKQDIVGEFTAACYLWSPEYRVTCDVSLFIARSRFLYHSQSVCVEVTFSLSVPVSACLCLSARLSVCVCVCVCLCLLLFAVSVTQIIEKKTLTHHDITKIAWFVSFQRISAFKRIEQTRELAICLFDTTTVLWLCSLWYRAHHWPLILLTYHIHQNLLVASSTLSKCSWQHLAQG